MENLNLNLNSTLSKTAILEIKCVHLSILDISLYYVEEQKALMEWLLVIVIRLLYWFYLLEGGSRPYFPVSIHLNVSLGVNIQEGSQNY